VIDGNFPENPARKAFREAVEIVAQKAREALPEANGRIDSAIKIVLQGDVELLEDGRAKVASQSNGTTKYFIVNGSCECPDAKKATQGFCKHRIAYGLYKRAFSLAKQRLETELNGNRPEPTSPLSDSLPEAPASCNCYVEVAGRKVQITLRDSNEARLLSRLESLLARFPAEELKFTTPPEGWCSKHSVQMTLHRNKNGSWWSHKTSEGWCHRK
jgi:hypothetical protein